MCVRVCFAVGLVGGVGCWEGGMGVFFCSNNSLGSETMLRRRGYRCSCRYESGGCERGCRRHARPEGSPWQEVVPCMFGRKIWRDCCLLSARMLLFFSFERDSNFCTEVIWYCTEVSERQWRSLSPFISRFSNFRIILIPSVAGRWVEEGSPGAAPSS